MRKFKNPLLKVVMVITIALGIVSCGSDTPTSKEFRYLALEKAVLLPTVNEREFSFYAFSFDIDKNNWELTLNDGTKNISITLSRIEKTAYSWTSIDEFMQKIYCKVPALGTGNYTLTIKNKITGQLQSDVFLVRDDTFDDIRSAATTSYSFEETQNYLFYQNTSNIISNDINTNGIEKVVLKNITTFNPIVAEYTINNKTLYFTIPKSTPVGVYYLAVYYNSGLNSYFEKELIVLEEQKPVITSVNKTTFASGEYLILKGKNFRYTIDDSYIPTRGLEYIRTKTKLVFNNGSRESEISMGMYEDDERYADINNDFTELKLKIPAKENFYIFSDVDKTYFEGEVYLQSGPYKTDPFTLRINF